MNILKWCIGFHKNLIEEIIDHKSKELKVFLFEPNKKWMNDYIRKSGDTFHVIYLSYSEVVIEISNCL